jgi:hypothetical protein
MQRHETALAGSGYKPELKVLSGEFGMKKYVGWVKIT